MKVWCENLFSPRRTPSMCTHQAQLSVFLICGWIIILSKISHHCLCAWWMHIKGPQYLVPKNVRFFQEQKNTSKNLAGHRLGNLAQMCIVGTYTALLDSLRKVYYRGIQNKPKTSSRIDGFLWRCFSPWKKRTFLGTKYWGLLIYLSIDLSEVLIFEQKYHQFLLKWTMKMNPRFWKMPYGFS